MPGSPPPLWKQLLGAVLGGGLALGLYYGYEYGKPRLLAYVTIPASQESGVIRVSDTDRESDTYDRISARAKEIAEKFKSRMVDPADLLADEKEEPVEPVRAPMPPVVPPSEDRPLSETPSIASMYETRITEESAATSPVPVAVPSTLSASIVAKSDAPALPDSGLPLVGVIGAALGAAVVRVKRR